jgi:hypothetical protein
MHTLLHTYCFILISAMVQSQPIDSLIARFSFNGTEDLNQKYRAVAYGAVQGEDRFGNKNHSLYFHGNAGNYINLGTGEALKPYRGSVSLWIKIDHIMHKGRGIESNPVIFTRVHAGEEHNEAYYIGLDMNSGSLGSCMSVSDNEQVSLYSGTIPSLRKWHHIVFTYDDAFFSVYLDGALEAKALKNFRTVFLEGDSIILGNRLSRKNNRFFNGWIDDVEIYGKVLSPHEVIHLYNSPNPNKRSNLLKYILLFILSVILILFVAWLIRWRIRWVIAKERALLNQSYEKDIRILRAQMSPHFIFNSLNSILQFIIVNENDKAELYLTKFSKLIRKHLESNTRESIRLSDELDLLNGYVEIESLRFNNVFSYHIEVSAQLDPNAVYIPHFLIQPFVENAIWHGLLRKKGNKSLSILFELPEPGIILCTIDDNGIGRRNQKADKLFAREKSLAIDFAKQRLELFSKMKKISFGLTIVDKLSITGESEGTTVKLTIPILN